MMRRRDPVAALYALIVPAAMALYALIIWLSQ